MHTNVAGALLNSALYLLCVFVAGLVTGNKGAWLLSIIALGATYVGHLLAYEATRREFPNRDQCEPYTHQPMRLYANAMVWFSIALGIAAGLALLF